MSQYRDVPREVAYCAGAYNSLLCTGDALVDFDKCGGSWLVSDCMKELFRRHNVQRKLGVALLHRHHTLKKGDRMTEIRGSRGPAQLDIGQPRVWKVNTRDGRVIELEFSTEAAAVDWHDLRLKAFVSEFVALLFKHQAQKILGLCVYPGDGHPGYVERTTAHGSECLSPQEV